MFGHLPEALGNHSKDNVFTQDDTSAPYLNKTDNIF